MPPPGGFQPLKYKRNLPVRGPSALTILGAVIAISGYGFYRIAQGNLEKRYAWGHFFRDVALLIYGLLGNLPAKKSGPEYISFLFYWQRETATPTDESRPPWNERGRL